MDGANIDTLKAALRRQGFEERHGYGLGALAYRRRHVALGGDMLAFSFVEHGRMVLRFEVMTDDREWHHYIVIAVEDFAAAARVVEKDLESIERAFHDLYRFGETEALRGCTFDKTPPAEDDWPEFM